MNGKAAVCEKRTFTQSRIMSGLMGSQKIQRLDVSPATRPSRLDTSIFNKSIVIEENSCKKDECLSPMGHNETTFNLNVK
jgi:hypothetical protein